MLQKLLSNIYNQHKFSQNTESFSLDTFDGIIRGNSAESTCAPRRGVLGWFSYIWSPYGGTMTSLKNAQEDIEFITTKMAVIAYFNIRGFIFILIIS